MFQLPWILMALLGAGSLLVLSLAWVFYKDPVEGMAQATHRPEQLPLVMIDRYVAVAVIQIGLVLFGNLQMAAMFCVAGMIMGFGDGYIYARAGHPHIKHTLSGVLALVGLVLTLYFIAAGV